MKNRLVFPTPLFIPSSSDFTPAKMRSGFPETPFATTSPSSSCFHFLPFLLLPRFSISLFLQVPPVYNILFFGASLLPCYLSLSFSTPAGLPVRQGTTSGKVPKLQRWRDLLRSPGPTTRCPWATPPVTTPRTWLSSHRLERTRGKWSYLHYSAVRNPEIMRGLLEKCRGDNSKKWDVNTPGPGGYTPLMLAVTQKSPDGFPLPSRSSSSSDSSGEHSEHNGLLFSPMTKAMQLVPHSDTSSPAGSFTGSPFNCSVDALLSTRVKLDATNDYGRTALHLAAVCGRGDYVKKLLLAGAYPNVQDNWGQSALHAAIGAAAEGSFQVS